MAEREGLLATFGRSSLAALGTALRASGFAWQNRRTHLLFHLGFESREAPANLAEREESIRLRRLLFHN